MTIIMFVILVAAVVIALLIGFYAGRIDGAIKVYYMTKDEARKFIWGGEGND